MVNRESILEFGTWIGINESDALRKVLSDNEFSFYFRKGTDFFGAPEESRIVFARLKHPDKEEGKSWASEASFAGIDLNRAAKGETSQKVFGSKDINEIKVVTKEDIESKLIGKKK
jgi:hypothetical protein